MHGPCSTGWTGRQPQSSKWRPTTQGKNNQSPLHSPTVGNLQSRLWPNPVAPLLSTPTHPPQYICLTLHTSTNYILMHAYISYHATHHALLYSSPLETVLLKSCQFSTSSGRCMEQNVLGIAIDCELQWLCYCSSTPTFLPFSGTLGNERLERLANNEHSLEQSKQYKQFITHELLPVPAYWACT